MAILTEYEYKPPDEEIEHEYEVVPCPFCGSDKHQEFDESGDVGSKLFYVRCTKCGARGPSEPGYVIAARRWNRSDPCIG